MRRILILLLVVSACHAKRAGKDYFGTQVSPPGILALRRAAATLVIVTGRKRSRAMCRRFQIGLVIVGLLAMLVPLL